MKKLSRNEMQATKGGKKDYHDKWHSGFGCDVRYFDDGSIMVLSYEDLDQLINQCLLRKLRFAEFSRYKME